ncbi:sensor histidine kinase [Streptomyces hoynatensis]|uniref:histidine kinase n=1 Tax=Streptomyces hoynatensis TaxID=1141874 RepID=A0A3A9YYD8_9ACTN|nr:histidine kinase [Streptomyces hoynatensis]RKN40905.1 two-component sensor histidine kinase [Streptomyces hoynatensis]
MEGMRRPHRDDLLIAVSGLLGGLTMWLAGVSAWPWTDQGHDPLVLLPLVAMTAAELLRRTAPRAALPLSAAALAGDQLAGSQLATVLMFTDVVYAAVLYGGPRLSAALIPGSLALTGAATLGALAWVRDPAGLTLGVTCGLLTVLPAFTGLLVRNHRDAAAAERLRAEQTRLLAEMDRAQAVAAERARMARELHDVVAHHLSAIAIHSTAALSLDEPAADRDALRVIRENSTRGLAEMRRLIGLLRAEERPEPAAEPRLAPSLEGIGALLRRAREAGAPGRLSFAVHDELPPGLALPAPVELAAYRIVQEALTNAVKHAAPGRVAVRLRLAGERLHVTVSSPYRERSAARAPGARAGLIGMRERVALLDGRFEAGPRPAEGAGREWLVSAELPLAERVMAP